MLPKVRTPEEIIEAMRLYVTVNQERGDYTPEQLKALDDLIYDMEMCWCPPPKPQRCVRS